MLHILACLNNYNGKNDHEKLQGWCTQTKVGRNLTGKRVYCFL